MAEVKEQVLSQYKHDLEEATSEIYAEQCTLHRNFAEQISLNNENTERMENRIEQLYSIIDQQQEQRVNPAHTCHLHRQAGLLNDDMTWPYKHDPEPVLEL